jgi:signal transduction histidine kinase
MMAGITYFAARQTFLNERQTASQRQAFANASLIQNALRSPGTQVDQLISSVDTLPGSRSVLQAGGQWYATSISVGQSAVPAQERALVLAGTPASQLFSLGGTPQLVIGVPLPAVHATYFEVFSLDELAGTLRALAFALAAAALVTTLAGAAVGRWASSRALRPLSDVTEAAVAIAGGELDTRMEVGDDVDLQELASAFNRMTANLQDRIEREARFTSDVSHELRSPLTTLTATVGVLEGHRAELGPRAQSALDLLDGDLRRFTRMVDDLL